MNTISYAVTVCNEAAELLNLLTQLDIYKRPQDEVVVQVDSDNHTQDVLNVIAMYPYVVKVMYPLNKDFANFKNNLKSNCKNDYIVFVDADEFFADNLIQYLPIVLDNNPVDLFLVPRKNIVFGLTQDHIDKWRWNLDDQNRVNWPDFQMRVIANRDYMSWKNKVHETIEGYNTISMFPIDNEDWCLIHVKNIEKQEKQNELYSKL
jgi:hypothetical protein